MMEGEEEDGQKWKGRMSMSKTLDEEICSQHVNGTCCVSLRMGLMRLKAN